MPDNERFCHVCGTEWSAPAVKRGVEKQPTTADAASLVNKSAISNSTVIGQQDKYEASNITIHNNITEDHSRVTVVCAVSGKHVYMDNSVECPVCHKSVSMEYYVEKTKRCENCEREAVEAFKAFAARVMSGGLLDAEHKRQLDDEAKRLKIGHAVCTEILRSMQRSVNSRKNATLTSVQEAELEAAVRRLMSAGSKDDVKAVFDSLSVMHEVSSNYVISFWYWLVFAIYDPEKFIRCYEDELADDYWQRYWGFLAYCIVSSPKGSVAIDRLRTSFPDREDDLRLAETVYYVARSFDDFDNALLERAGKLAAEVRKEYLSKPLHPIYDTLCCLVNEGIKKCLSRSEEFRFIIMYVFQGWKISKRTTDGQQEAKEGNSGVQKRQPSSKVAGTKEFAGFDDTLPKQKKGGMKKIFIIISVVLLLAIIAIFMIPAPDSML